VAIRKSVHVPYTLGQTARNQMRPHAEAAIRSHIERILTTGNTGQYLVPEDLEPAIVEALLLMQPLATLMDIQQAKGHTHEAVVRDTIPSARFEGQLATPTYTNATYARRTDYLAIMRIYGRLPGFFRSASQAFVDVVDEEITAAVEGLANLWEFSAIWANHDADTYQVQGIEARLLGDATAAADNIFDLDAVITLTDLDNALVAASQQFRGVDGDPKVWICSPSLINFISGLQTKISINIASAEMFEGRLRMSTYGGIPMLSSGFTKPAGTTTSPSLSGGVTAVTSGGALADATYYYAISSVTEVGEQLMGTSGNDTLTGGSGAGSVDLAWTADSDALLYKIWRSTTSASADNLRLLAVIAAKTYDSNGNVSGTVASYTDDGSLTTTSTMHPLESGEETMWLANLNPSRGAAWLSLVDDMGDPIDQLLRYVELARIQDTTDFMIKTYLGQKSHHPRLHAVLRRVRITS